MHITIFSLTDNKFYLRLKKNVNEPNKIIKKIHQMICIILLYIDNIIMVYLNKKISFYQFNTFILFF